jgi:hypothetical protein
MGSNGLRWVAAELTAASVWTCSSMKPAGGLYLFGPVRVTASGPSLAAPSWSKRSMPCKARAALHVCSQCQRGALPGGLLTSAGITRRCGCPGDCLFPGSTSFCAPGLCCPGGPMISPPPGLVKDGCGPRISPPRLLA